MKTYTIGNNALKTENDMVMIGDYYMEKNVYNTIKNNIREHVLTDQRIAAKRAERYWKERHARIKARRKEQVKNTVMTTIVLFGFFLLMFGMVLHGLMF